MCLIVPRYGHKVLFKLNSEVSAKSKETYQEQPTYLLVLGFCSLPSILFCKPTLAAQSTTLFPTKVTTSL